MNVDRLTARPLEVIVRALSRVTSRRRERGGIAVLTYHSVSDDPWGPLDRYRISSARFARQMQLIEKAGFRVITLQKTIEYLTDPTAAPHGRTVSLTFDDGYEDFYRNALAVLRRHRFPAAVFLVSGLVGRSYAWSGVEDFPARPPRLMSWTQVRDASHHGVELHSHSCTHPKLPAVSSESAAFEIGESKSTIQRMVSKPVEFFAYPHGEASLAVIRQVRDAGYRAAFSTQVGLCAPGQDLYYLPRVKVRPTDTSLDFVFKLYTGWGWRESLLRRGRQASRAPRS